MQRIILHLDLDYFYAQVEEARNPEIKNKPVVICQYSGRSEDSGAVATTNYIARKFNVKRKYSDTFEQLSIDEASIDISNKMNNDYQNATVYGNEIQHEIKTSEKLTCSIGIGPNKLIAKMSADSNKPNGTTVVTPENVEDFLFPQAVNKLYGIGPKTQSKLAEYKIRTIEELSNS